MVQKKGFTLIELIIVIALIALLATTVILVINPVKLFQEARDSQRIADLGQMNSAMSIFLAAGTATGNYLSNAGVATGADTCSGASAKCWTHNSVAGATGCGTAGQGAGVRYGTKTSVTNNQTSKVDGTGWIPVSLGTAPAIPAWPIDPKGNSDASGLFYAYACEQGAGVWEFSAKMESNRYSSGAENVENTDGGSISNLFEVGTGISTL